MARRSVVPTETKRKIVLSVLRNEVSMAAAARQASVSRSSVGRWRKAFVDAGARQLAADEAWWTSTRAERRETQLAQLTDALDAGRLSVEVLRQAEGTYMMRRVQRVVSAHFELHPAALRHLPHGDEDVYPWQLAVFLARELTSLSIVEIGQLSGTDALGVIGAHGWVIAQLRWSTDGRAECDELADRITGREHALWSSLRSLGITR